MTITTRAGKGSPLTNAELDANWADLVGQTASLNTQMSTANGQVTTLNTQMSTANGQISTLNTQMSTKIDATSTVTLTNKRVTPRTISLPTGTSITPTGDTADQNTHVNTQAVGTLTVNAPSGTPTEGQHLVIRIKSTNVQTFAWNAIYRGSDDIALATTSSGAGKTDYIGFMYNATDSKWDCVSVNFGF